MHGRTLIATGVAGGALAASHIGCMLWEDAMILESLITCPHCATARTETMPVDACQFFYVCTGCGGTLRPRQGVCCVFCSYGSVPCPPIQAERSGKAGPASCRSG